MNDDALEIEASSNGHMMQMRFGQPRVGRAPQARGARCLRDRAFDACTKGIRFDERRRALLVAPLKQSGMDRWGREGERAAPLSVGTAGTDRTAATGGRRKADDHRLLLAPILRSGPAHTLLPLRTGGDLGVPI